MRKAITVSQGVPANSGAYSPALIVGDLCFVSGQSPIDPMTGAVVDGDVSVQAHQALTNLFSALTAGGFTPAQLAYVHIVLSDISDWNAVNAVYEQRMKDVAPLPARMIVGGDVLPAEARLEIQGMASLA